MRGDVDAFDLGQCRQGIGAAQACTAGVGPGADDFGDRLFAFADEKRVEEGVHRFGVKAGGAAGDDQRLIRPLSGAQRDAGQIERGEHVGIELFVRQAEPEHIEVDQRMAGLQAVERDARLAHRGQHVHPRRVGALGQHVGLRVDAVVQDRHAQI